MPAIKTNPDKSPHIHTWVRRARPGGGTYPNQFTCEFPGCFTIRQRSDLRGERTLCGICHGNEFILTRADLLRARPRCDECSQTALAKEKRELKVKENVTKKLEEMGIG